MKINDKRIASFDTSGVESGCSARFIVVSVGINAAESDDDEPHTVVIVVKQQIAQAPHSKRLHFVLNASNRASRAALSLMRSYCLS